MTPLPTIGRILRTPDSRFAGLTDFPWTPHYREVGGLRIASIDEGPRDAPVVLLMHGEPTWSYLYRKMIPILLAAGHRVVAPDLVGFGRSDKPAALGDYSYLNHVEWMKAWLQQADLQHITLFCQDWGSLIGLRMAAELPDFHIPHAEKIEWMIETNGWALEPVPARTDIEPPVPGYAYTIGFPAAFDFPKTR